MKVFELYRLPDGAIVSVDATASRGAAWIDYTMKGGTIVMAESIREATCEHGTALDVHCCNCHSGFIFDPHHECEETNGEDRTL